MDLFTEPAASVNGHIAVLLKKLHDGFEQAKAITPPAFFTPWQQAQFLKYAHRKFLTQYCQERLYMSQRFDVMGLMLGRALR